MGHVELLVQPGLYRRLWEIQTSVEPEFFSALDGSPAATPSPRLIPTSTS